MNAKKLDPITFQLISNALKYITRQMDATLQRTAYTPLFAEGKDYSVAMFDGEGHLAAQSVGVPIHLGAMSYAIMEVIKDIGMENLEPGDLVYTNDPFKGGTHLTDTSMIRPVFVENDIVAFLVVRAHQNDVGGMTPGSCASNAKEIYAEGLVIPPVKLWKKGNVDKEILEFILSNVRGRDAFMGDMNSQLAATFFGEKRMGELMKKWGKDNVLCCMGQMMDNSEYLMRQAISKLSEGTYEDTAYMDDDGFILDRPVKIKLAITIKGDELTADFTGTDSEVLGPINMTLPVTVSAVNIGIITAIIPDIDPNWGSMRPIKVIAPVGSLVNARKPRAVFAGNTQTSTRVLSLVWRALLPIVPERLTGDHSNSGNDMGFGGVHPITKLPYVYYSFVQGSGGGRRGNDGLTNTDIYISNCPDLGSEILEYRYSWRHNRIEVVPDSAGPGKWRGGASIVREFESVSHEAEFAIMSDRYLFLPWGVLGGGPGESGRSLIVRKDGTKEWLRSKQTDVILAPGDRIIVYAGAGGGYDDPLERDPEAVKKDVKERLITLKGAAKDYGVILDPKTYEIDWNATKKLRKKIRNERRTRLYRDIELVRQDVIKNKISLQEAARDHGVILDPNTLEVLKETTEKQRAELKKMQLRIGKKGSLIHTT